MVTHRFIRRPGARRGIRSTLGRVAILVMLQFGVLLPALAEFTASVDRQVIDEHDALVLELRVDDQVFVGGPDFSALEQDFTPIGNPVRSSQLIIAGGRREAATTWTLTLQPKRRGTLQIPAIEWDGRRTQPITITVTAPTPQEQAVIERIVDLETELGKDAVWVQEQLLYTVRLFYAADAVLFGDLPPTPVIRNALVQPVGDSRPGSVTRGGIRYNVVEQRYAIVPQRSGTLSIPPETFSGAIRIAERGQTRRKNIRIASDGHEVEVRPQPDAWPADVPWLPARDLTLEQTWSVSPPSFRAGEPVSRTLELFAKGVAASTLPELRTGAAENARVYPDQPALDEGFAAGAFVATRIQSQVIIPETEGAMTLPEIRVPWWDVDRGELRTAVIPGLRFRVDAAPGGAAAARTTPQTAGADPQAGVAAPGADADVTAAASDAAPDPVSGADAAPLTRTVGPLDVDLRWRWLLAALLAAGLGMFCIRWLIRRRSRSAARGAPAPPETTGRPQTAAARAAADREDVLAACSAGDPAAARAALTRWRRGAQLDDEERSELESRIRALDAVLFAPGAGRDAADADPADPVWDGAALAAWLQAHPSRRRARSRRRAQPALPPLHPDL